MALLLIVSANGINSYTLDDYCDDNHSGNKIMIE